MSEQARPDVERDPLRREGLDGRAKVSGMARIEKDLAA